MLDFLMNDKEYEIQANGQVATILSQFNSDYVMDVVRNTLSEQFNHFDTVPKNIEFCDKNSMVDYTFSLGLVKKPQPQ